jgi:predicted GIY-YIG superfamily endonuclease
MSKATRSEARRSLFSGLPESSGIYTLKFINGDSYIGQAKNVLKRVSTHARRWTDISAIEAVPCSIAELDEQELSAIVTAEPDVKASIRHLIATLASRGTTPYRTNHCYQMADLCLETDSDAAVKLAWAAA